MELPTDLISIADVARMIGSGYAKASDQANRGEFGAVFKRGRWITVSKSMVLDYLVRQSQEVLAQKAEADELVGL